MKIAGRKLRPIALSVTFAACLLVAASIVSIYLFPKASISERNKSEAQTEVHTIISRFTGIGELVYKDIAEACDDSGTVGLEVREVCGFTGYKLFKVKEDAKQAIIEADKKLQALGLERKNDKGQEFVEILESKSGLYGSGVYYQGGYRPWLTRITLYYYGVDKTVPEIQQLIQKKILHEPTSDEYIYGIKAYSPYHSIN